VFFGAEFVPVYLAAGLSRQQQFISVIFASVLEVIFH
jgi:hypothetical protein